MYKDGKVTEIGCFQKDGLPMWLFQFGNCQFPQDCYSAAEDRCLLITPCSVKKFDGKTIAIDYEARNINE
jgi:phosphoribosyl 1,2-cyclic phosphodiesterase